MHKNDFTIEKHEEGFLLLECTLVGGLVGWVLWYINLCRLFNAKSIFFYKESVLFQTIQFSINTLFKCKYSLIVKNISISSYSV